MIGIKLHVYVYVLSVVSMRMHACMYVIYIRIELGRRRKVLGRKFSVRRPKLYKYMVLVLRDIVGAYFVR